MNCTSFAVIVTSYNYRDYVADAVNSALAQTRQALQVIVVDDGSTDGTPELLQELYRNNPRVTLILDENGGQLKAFARGVAIASADVVAFLDSDDYWKPNYLETVGAMYDARPDVDFVFSDLQVFGDEDYTMEYARRAVDLGYTAVSTWALTHWYGAPSSALSMRAIWAQQAVSLPEDMYRVWKLSADNCLVYGASILGARKFYLPTQSVAYRIHGKNGWWASRTSSQAYFNRLRSRALIGHYARVAGIDDSCIELAKLEFYTKPDPDRAERRRYAGICLRGDAPWWKRVERALSVLRGRRSGR